MAGESTYQPHWGEKKKHPHHHVHGANDSNRRLGGALRMRDKQAYYGLMFALVLVLLFGAYKLVSLFVHEYRAMPKDDPQAEMKVDELRIHKADEHDALLAADSLARSYQFDSSMIHHVQIETRPVYRPPRKHDEWYLTKREWKEMWKALKRKDSE